MTDEGPVDFVDNVFKKYDAFSGAPLREAVAKDYTIIGYKRIIK